MKKNKTNEENMFQKYDDLFAEQDEKYDTNNTSRYAKKKNVRSEDVEYQRYEPKKDKPVDQNKRLIAIVVSSFIIFGFTMFMMMNSATLREVPFFVIIGGFALLSSFFRSTKRKK